MVVNLALRNGDTMTVKELIEHLQTLPQEKELLNAFGEELIVEEKESYVEIS